MGAHQEGNKRWFLPGNGSISKISFGAPQDDIKWIKDKKDFKESEEIDGTTIIPPRNQTKCPLFQILYLVGLPRSSCVP